MASYEADHAKLMAWVKLQGAAAKDRKGLKPLPTEMPTRDDLKDKFASTYKMPTKGKLMDGSTVQLKSSFTANDVYAPSIEVITKLKPISIADLQFEEAHYGRVLIVKTFGHPVLTSAFQNAVEDADGNVACLALFNLPPTLSPREVLPHGCVFAIKEPFLTKSSSIDFPFHVQSLGRNVIVRVDHFSNFLLLPHGNSSIPAALPAPEQTFSVEELFILGEDARLEEDHIAAVRLFDTAMRIIRARTVKDDEPEQTGDKAEQTDIDSEDAKSMSFPSPDAIVGSMKEQMGISDVEPKQTGDKAEQTSESKKAGDQAEKSNIENESKDAKPTDLESKQVTKEVRGAKTTATESQQPGTASKKTGDKAEKTNVESNSAKQIDPKSEQTSIDLKDSMTATKSEEQDHRAEQRDIDSKGSGSNSEQTEVKPKHGYATYKKPKKTKKAKKNKSKKRNKYERAKKAKKAKQMELEYLKALSRKILRSRAAAQIRLGRFEPAIYDALESLSITGNSDESITDGAEAIFLAGRGEYGMENYQQAHVHFQKVLEYNPEHAPARDFMARTLDRLNEQSGLQFYNFTDMQLTIDAGTLELDHASWLAGTKLEHLGANGRGLVAATAFKKGDVIMVEKAFILGLPYKSNEHAIRIGPPSAQASTRLYALLDKLNWNPTFAEKFIALSDRGYHARVTERAPATALTVMVVNGRIVVDAFRTEAIAAVNGFSCRAEAGAPPGREEAAGVWLHAAMMNHSCVPNARSTFMGNMMIVRAARDIAEDEEILISYLEPNKRFEERTRILDDMYDFECMCVGCVRERQKRAFEAMKEVGWGKEGESGSGSGGGDDAYDPASLNLASITIG